MAELNNKLWWARLECPKGLFAAIDVEEKVGMPQGDSGCLGVFVFAGDRSSFGV
jgi:hypothetical protein